MALFATACLLITGDLFFGTFFIAALAVQALNFPTVSKISRELNLTRTEIDRFYQDM